jgi:pimeloyl-ACP methyl ester carboxylesterase
MQRPASQSQPLSRAFKVIRDVDAVVREAQKRSGSRQVALLGWATGGLWAGFYASLRPERVNHLILLNSLYAGSGPHPLLGPGSTTSDPQHPDRLNPSIGGYALADAASLLRPWDRSIPDEDKARWRDPVVASAYVEAAIASDPRSLTTTPPSLRAPSGALEDSFIQASGRRLYDAGSISATVLLIRSGRDFWSRTEDLENFTHDAVHAKRVERLDLPEATHFVHLERSDRGRDLLLAAVRELLNSSS